jgi:predicted RND superfamily exporter protein
MFSVIGRQIEKTPWMIVITVVIITLILSSFTAGLEFKTDFEDFTPDDPLVKANLRLGEYFGQNQQTMIIRAASENNQSILDPKSIRDLNEFQKKLLENKYVINTGSFTNLIDLICFLEFFNSIENCSDAQIATSIQDLLEFEEENFLKLFDTDDSNEIVDVNGKKSVDVKNCQVIKDQDNFIFEIEVYDLSNVESELSAESSLVNITEWYINFENELNQLFPFQIGYRICARMTTFTEVEHFEWKFGLGILRNLKNYIEISKSPKISIENNIEPFLGLYLSEYETEVYIPLDSTNLTFDISENKITIKISRVELGNFGIAPTFESYELPAKLTNFSVGSRYYQIQESFYQTTKRFETIQNSLIMSFLSSLDFRNFSNQSDGDFDFSFLDNDSFDFQNEWKHIDVAPDSGTSSNVLNIFPSFFDELKDNALSFISNEYQDTGSAYSTIILAGIKNIGNYREYTEQTREILNSIDSLDENISSFIFNATGAGVLSVEIDEVTGEANQIIGPSIFIIIIAVLFISFRKPSYVLITILALLISAVWLFGTMALLQISFNVIAVAIFPIVLGLGVDYSVHLFHNYRTELMKGRTPGQAMRKSIEEIGTAMFLAMVTTVIAFISFLSARIPPIRDFGIILALGVIYTFITSIAFSAPVRYLADRRRLKVIKKSKSPITITNIMNTTSRIVISNKKKIFIVMVLISFIMALGAARIETGFDFDHFVPENTPSREIDVKIAEEFPFSSQDQEYILIEGEIATKECLEGIAKTHQNFEDDSYLSKNVDGTINARSIYTIISEAVENNQSLVTLFNIDEKTSLPTTDNDIKGLLNYLMISEEYGGSLSSVLHKNGSKYDATVIRIYIDSSLETQEGSVTEELKQLKQELNDDIEKYGNATAIATGGLIATLTITESLTVSQATSTAISVVLAAFVVILVYKNPVLGLIAMIPVGVSIIWILGTMFYIGYTLNILTITVTSITIGIGIDYAIHATQRFRYTADRTGDFTTSVCETISQTGGALLIAALTTTLGFGILVFAPIPPQQQFGLILAVTIIYSFLTSIFFLPIILYIWGKRQKKRKGYIISPKQYEFSDKDLDFYSCEEK